MSTNQEHIKSGVGQIDAMLGKQNQARLEAENTVVGKDEYLKGFIFEGMTLNGRIKMPIEAPSEAILRQWLEEGHIEVIKIKKQIGTVSSSTKIKGQDIANFVGQLADRKVAGQGDIDAIKSCAEASSNTTLRVALREIAERMENGVAPDQAFDESYIYNIKKKTHTTRRTFPKELISTIKAGKRGQAVTLLKDFERRLNSTLEKKAEIISELIYPAITVLISIILSQVMVFVVIPQFKPLYEGILGDKTMSLPFLTALFVGISDFMTSWTGITVMALVVGLISYAIYWAYRTDRGIGWRQERELYMPKIGVWRLNINLFGISKLLALYQGSVHLTSLGQVMKATDLVTALRETAAGSPHVVYARAFESMAKTIEEFSGGFAPTGRPYAHLIHKDFYPLMETGAQGDMSDQVLKLADQMQEDFQRQLSRLMKLITPATVIFMGLVLGAVVIAMYLPMLDIIGRMAATK